MNPYSPSTPLIQTYDEALDFLNSLDISAMKLGLGRVRELLQTLGNPQDSLPTIHIAGTNGKGSVTAMLASVLKYAGYKVGTFTSPHLIHIRERIAINGSPILPDDFTFEVAALKEQLELLQEPRDAWPTYFEFLNVMAYQVFKRKGVDVIIMETGLGGRLDSTNIVKHPNLTVITSIGMDHMAILGDTLAKIAAEKAGIIKVGTPVVFNGSIPDEAQAVILQHAAAANIPVIAADADCLQVESQSSVTEGLLITDGMTGHKYRLSLLGPYQKNNLAVVLSCVSQLRQQGYSIDDASLQDGLAHTCWPVRFQYFHKQHLVLDGSHNADGFTSLQESLSLYFPQEPLIWLISLRNNRDPQALFNLMQQFTPPLGVIVCQPNPRHLFHPPESLSTSLQEALDPTIPIIKTASPTDGLTALLRLQAELSAQKPLGQKPLGLVTGSLYTAGEILQALESRHSAD